MDSDEVLDLIEKSLKWLIRDAECPAIGDIDQDGEGVTFLSIPGDK